MTNPDKTPAEYVDVQVNVPSESDIQTKSGTTDSNGLARITLNMVQTTKALTIRVRPVMFVKVLAHQSHLKVYVVKLGQLDLSCP